MSNLNDSFGTQAVKLFLISVIISLVGLLLLAKYHKPDLNKTFNSTNKEPQIGSIYDFQGPYYTDEDLIIIFRFNYEYSNLGFYTDPIFHDKNYDKNILFNRVLATEYEKDILNTEFVVEEDIGTHDKKTKKFLKSINSYDLITQLVFSITKMLKDSEIILNRNLHSSGLLNSFSKFNFSKESINILRAHHFTNKLLKYVIEDNQYNISNSVVINRLLFFLNFFYNDLEVITENNKITQKQFNEWQTEKGNRFRLSILFKFEYIVKTLPLLILHEFLNDDSILLKFKYFKNFEFILLFKNKMEKYENRINLIIGMLYQIDCLLDLESNEEQHNAIIKKLDELNRLTSEKYSVMI